MTRRHLPLAFVLVGLVLRLHLATATYGSNDIEHWRRFAILIEEHGTLGIYGVERLYNHAPLAGWLAVASRRASVVTGIPFSTCFKIPGILSDGLVLFLLFRRFRERRDLATATWAAALFATCPIAILSSGYHGSTDPILAALSLLALVLHEESRPLAAGLALGAAINVKLIPLLLVPSFLARTPSRDGLLRLSAGLAVGALPFVPVLACAGGAFFDNVIAYASHVDRWGLSFLIGEPLQVPRLAPLFGPLAACYQAAGRGLVVLAVLGLAVASRARGRPPLDELSLASLACFLVLTPGFAVQYLVSIVPIFFAVDLARATLYSWLAGACVGLTYLAFRVDGLPRFASDHTRPIPVAAASFGLLAWTLLLLLLVRTCRETLVRERTVKTRDALG